MKITVSVKKNRFILKGNLFKVKSPDITGFRISEVH
jgi:hypothetical protein